MKSGVYGIFSTIDGECLYIGQSKNIDNRLKGHLSSLRNKTHIRTEFIDWYEENGATEKLLDMKVLELCEDEIEERLKLEIKWFNKLNPRFFRQYPSMNKTWIPDEATRQKLSNRNTTRYQFDDEIVDLYVNEKMSTGEISKIVPLSQPGVLGVLKRLGIETRGHGWQSKSELKSIEERKLPVIKKKCFTCNKIFKSESFSTLTCSKKCKDQYVSYIFSNEGKAERKKHQEQYNEEDILKMRYKDNKTVDEIVFITWWVYTDVQKIFRKSIEDKEEY